MEILTIDCDDCVLQASDACRGCLVSVLCGSGPVLEMDAEEADAIGRLGSAGLVPSLRHRRRAVPV